jgi:hypothetical protein
MNPLKICRGVDQLDDDPQLESDAHPET